MNWNPNAYFSPTETYAGSWPMKLALRQYFNELMGPQAGGQAALAAGQANDAPAQAYQQQMNMGAPMGGPSQDLAQGAFGNLIQGGEQARTMGRKVGSEVKQNAMQGAGNVAQDYGNTMTSQMQAQMALNQAQQNAGASGIGGALGLGNEFNSAMGMLFDPGNISGAFGKSSGPLAFMSPGSSKSPLGLPGPSMGSMFGGTGNAGSPATAGGFTPVSSANAANLASASGDSWLNPADISAIGPAAGGSGFFSSIMSMLPFLGG